MPVDKTQERVLSVLRKHAEKLEGVVLTPWVIKRVRSQIETDLRRKVLPIDSKQIEDFIWGSESD